MKKLKIFIVLFFTLFINTVLVSAADFNTYLSGNTKIYPGESTTITFGVKNSKAIYGLSTLLKYDKDKLEITSSKGLNGFGLTLGSSAVVDSTSSKSGKFTLFSITFKAKSSFEVGQSTLISFSNVESGDGDNLYIGSNTSITINMLAPKSSNNNFSYIKLDGNDLDLNKNSYSTTVDNSVDTVVIEAAKEDPLAKLSGTGTKSLKLYSNKFSLVVTAENGTKKTYVINIIRKDEDGNTSKPNEESTTKPTEKELLEVKNIKIEGSSFKFIPSQYEYNIKVESETEKLNIDVDNDNKDNKIEIINPDKLVIGQNLITIKVTDKNGKSSEYRIIVFRPEKEVVAQECEECKCDNTLYLIIICIELLIIISLIIFSIIKKKKSKPEVIHISESNY